MLKDDFPNGYKSFSEFFDTLDPDEVPSRSRRYGKWSYWSEVVDWWMEIAITEKVYFSTQDIIDATHCDPTSLKQEIKKRHGVIEKVKKEHLEWLEANIPRNQELIQQKFNVETGELEEEEKAYSLYYYIPHVDVTHSITRHHANVQRLSKQFIKLLWDTKEFPPSTVTYLGKTFTSYEELKDHWDELKMAEKPFKFKHCEFINKYFRIYFDDFHFGEGIGGGQSFNNLVMQRQAILELEPNLPTLDVSLICSAFEKRGSESILARNLRVFPVARMERRFDVLDKNDFHGVLSLCLRVKNCEEFALTSKEKTVIYLLEKAKDIEAK